MSLPIHLGCYATISALLKVVGAKPPYPREQFGVSSSNLPYDRGGGGWLLVGGTSFKLR